MDSPEFLRPICLVLAALTIIAGGLGMMVSFLIMGSGTSAEVTSGASGFLAGAILITGGVVSMTILTTRQAPLGATKNNFSEIS